MVLLNDFECSIQLMTPQYATRSRYFNLWFQPDFSIVVVVLRAFAHVQARLIFIESIVTMKPEDKLPFFKNFRTHSPFFLDKAA